MVKLPSTFEHYPSIGLDISADRKAVFENGQVIELSESRWEVFKARALGLTDPVEIIKHISNMRRLNGESLPLDEEAMDTRNLMCVESALRNKIKTPSIVTKMRYKK